MLVVFCWVRVWIVCQFELQRFEVFLDQLKPFEKFSPVPLSQLLTYAGSIAMTFDEPVLILCILVWSIARGSDVVSGEVGRGTMEFLLAQPIGRFQLMAAHTIVCVLGLAGLCGCVLLGLYLGIQTNSVKETTTSSIRIPVPFLPIEVPIQTGKSKTEWVPLSDRVDSELFIAPTMNLFGFGFILLAFSVLCSSVDKFRWRTIGVVVSTYVVQLLLYLLSRATEATSPISGATFFSCYQPDAMVRLLQEQPERAFRIFASEPQYLPMGLDPLGTTLVLIVIGLVLYLAAFIAFQHRDLPAPS
jgi:ABC-2 type transport system permease protein